MIDDGRHGLKTLPARRQCLTWTFHHGGFDYEATVGVYPDATVGEVFLGTGKAGTDLDIATRDSAVGVSLALQYGCPVDVLRGAFLRNEDGSPAGPLGKLLDDISAMVGNDEKGGTA